MTSSDVVLRRLRLVSASDVSDREADSALAMTADLGATPAKAGLERANTASIRSHKLRTGAWCKPGGAQHSVRSAFLAVRALRMPCVKQP